MRAEIWARPGAATFERIWEDPQALRISGTVRMSGTGDGEMQLPDTDATTDLADKLLLTDPDTPGNSTRALVRVYADGDVGGTDFPLHEWRVESVIPPTDNSDPTWEVSGLDPFSYLDDAEVKPWDWDGTDDYTSLFPDWIWGGRNLLGEEIQSTFRPHTMLVWNDATGGTFKLGVSFDGGAYTYTGNIAYNAAPAVIDVALNAIGYTTAVTGQGTVTNPWRVQFMSPEGVYIIVQDVALLTGGTGYISVEEIGAELPRGWEESKSYISNLNHGLNVEFRLSDGTGTDPALPPCDTSGWSIMFNGTEPRFPGIQKPVKVKPGGIYQASVWVYAQGANADVRLVIRDLFENGIAATPDFSSGTTIVANTWTQMTISNVTIPSNIADVLFRIGHVGTGDPPKIFVACPEFTEGLAAATIGDIWEQLYADAVTNHSGVRVVWEDESATLPGNVFLKLGFTDVLDSASAAWDNSVVSLTAKRGFSYGRVMKETLKLGYEARVVPVTGQDGQWQLEIYNPGTLGTDYTGDDFVGIRVGREVIRKAVRRFVPAGTQVTVENGNQGFSQAANAAAITSLGRLEYYTPERDLGTLVEAGLAADALLAKALARGRSIQPVILPGPDDPTPFIDYTVGDTIDLDDPDEGVTVSARLAALSYAVVDDLITYEPALSAETFVGSAAISQGVRQLLEAQDAIRREPPEDGPDLFTQGAWGEGGVSGFTIRVAASDATDGSKAAADYVCDGFNDNVEINAAIQFCQDNANGGRVLLSEGTFYVSLGGGSSIIFNTNNGGVLEGMGSLATRINNQDGWTAHTPMISLGQSVTLRNLAVIEYGAGCGGIEIDDYCLIENVYFGVSGNVIADSGSANWVTIRTCWIESGTYGILTGTSGRGCHFYDNNISNCVTGMSVGGTEMNIHDNWVYNIAEHGIEVNGAFDTYIHHNHVLECSNNVDNTYDGIIIAGNSDRNFVHGNTVRVAALGNTNRYGINVSAATCDNNVIIDNDLRNSGTTADYNDAGTGTIYRDITGTSAAATTSEVPTLVDQYTPFTYSGTLPATYSGTFRLPFANAAIIEGVLITVGTAPTGQAILVDVNKNGTTLFTTQANRPTIAAGSNQDVSEAVPDVTAVAAGDYLTVDIDQVGSGTAGADLIVNVRWRDV